MEPDGTRKGCGVGQREVRLGLAATSIFWWLAHGEQRLLRALVCELCGHSGA